MLERLPRAALLFDPAVVHDHDAIGQLERLLLVVGDEHAGEVNLVVQPAQPATQLLPDLGVERAERLVEQQHLRLDRERARQRDALALAAGQLRRIAVAQVVELHQLEQLVDLPRRSRRSAGRRVRGRTRRPNATFSKTVMWRNSA